jgi:hypothetical protein
MALWHVGLVGGVSAGASIDAAMNQINATNGTSYAAIGGGIGFALGLFIHWLIDQSNS